jgi:hypothetical protein
MSEGGETENTASAGPSRLGGRALPDEEDERGHEEEEAANGGVQGDGRWFGRSRTSLVCSLLATAGSPTR